MLSKTPKNTYLTVIKNTQLISIDLIVKNKENKYLLGLRNNKPAKNFWFVPGGRIRKLEDFADAIKRISLDEIGVELNNGKSLGVYRHLYKIILTITILKLNISYFLIYLLLMMLKLKQTINILLLNGTPKKKF